MQHNRFFVSFLSISVLFILGISFFVGFPGRTSSAPKIGNVSKSCVPASFSEIISQGESVAVFENKQVNIPKLAFENSDYDPVKVLGAALGLASEERWIEVDLSDQMLYAWEGNTKYLETSVSTGLPWTPTPTGEFRIWIKLRATKMEGGQGAYYYYLPNVPYVMFFENESVPGWRGYGLHGTYWHDGFGAQRSHGCVNLPTEVAGQLYYWVGPELPASKSSIRATDSNVGTRIIIHE